MGRPSLPQLLASAASLLFSAANGAPVAAGACSSSTFTFPQLFGAQGVSITASPVQNFTRYLRQVPDSQVIKGPLNFCNVTVTYTHTGQNDAVNVQVWLPTGEWNGRYVSVGGGGFATGAPDQDLMGVHISQGSAAATTDGGHYDGGGNASWALKSPGNIDYSLVYNFATIALEDLGVIGKAMTQQFFGSAHKYSYWTGCSMGGRQGYQMAQSQPDAYNGILANAPALRADELGITSLWAQVVLNTLKEFPPPCELLAIQAAAIEACDLIDAVADGIISRPDLCAFDPQTLVGKNFSCDGQQRTFSAAGAAAANAHWQGSPVLPSGRRDWIGMPIGTPLALIHGNQTAGLVNTVCEANNQNCRSDFLPLFINLPKYFVYKDPSYYPTTLSQADFDFILRRSRQQLTSILGTFDTDLTPFKTAGGKLMTFHGLEDNLLSARTTQQYVEGVKQNDKKYQDYLRYFEMPGVLHCAGGNGAYPLDGFNALVRWVEQGQAPDSVQALNQTDIALGNSTTARQRLLCMYPKVAVFQGGDPDKSASYRCVDSAYGSSGWTPVQ